jgi:hypothetical protein
VKRRGTAPLAVTVVASLLLLLTVAGPVRAECVYVPPWPPITEAVRSARLIVIGEVVTDFAEADVDFRDNPGPRDYALLVTEVLRGSAAQGDLIDVQYLLPNWPQTILGDDGGPPTPSCTSLRTEPGEVIAMAFDALHPGGPMREGGHEWVQPPTRYHAVGVIDPGPSDGPWDERERVTVAQLRNLASLPQTDVAPVGPPAHGEALVLVAAMAGAWLTLRWIRARSLEA